jgi:hypothetical protein
LRFADRFPEEAPSVVTMAQQEHREEIVRPVLQEKKTSCSLMEDSASKYRMPSSLRPAIRL